MKMKRCLLAVLLLLVFPLRGDVARAPQAVKAQDGSLADANLHYIGRWDKSDGHLYRSYWTGASLRTRFIGTEVAVKLAEGTTLAVSIDGEPLRGVNAGQGVTPLHSSPLAPGVHTLSVGGAGQNEEVAFQGLTLAPGGETRPAPARPLLEFVGDSISASVYGNYCILTGDALGADHVQIAFSARSLTSGYGCADEKTGLDAQYFRLKNFNHLDDNPTTPWN